MNRVAKRLLLATLLMLPLFATGCVYYPARPYHGAWVPGHWAGPRGDVWVEGHYR